jgi:protocatechuate 4,5-dioxygenase beta chain
MANLVAVLATTHHPFFYRASTAPPESRPDVANKWIRKVGDADQCKARYPGHGR